MSSWAPDLADHRRPAQPEVVVDRPGVACTGVTAATVGERACRATRCVAVSSTTSHQAPVTTRCRHSGSAPGSSQARARRCRATASAAYHSSRWVASSQRPRTVASHVRAVDRLVADEQRPQQGLELRRGQPAVGHRRLHVALLLRGLDRVARLGERRAHPGGQARVCGRCRHLPQTRTPQTGQVAVRDLSPADLHGEPDVVGPLRHQRVAALDELGEDQRRHRAPAHRAVDDRDVRAVPVVVDIVAVVVDVVVLVVVPVPWSCSWPTWSASRISTSSPTIDLAAW